MSDLFAGSSYRTPDVVPRPLLVRLLGWSRLPFYAYVFRELNAGRRAALAGRFDAAEFARRSEGIIRAAECCGGRLEVTGLEHLGVVAGPVVVLGNHMSFLETFALPAMILSRKDVCFVVKQSLLDHPFLGPVLRGLDAIALTRTNPREDLRVILQEGVRRLQSGQSLCIFPQSTRSHDFVAANFSSIGTKVAQRAGCPVVPVALRTDFVGNGTLIKDLGPVYPERAIRFAFGAAVDAADARAAQQQVVAAISASLSAWGVVCR
ncbi:MAG: 1-acyl-sn-glycerol-3-phosphate acyltransferase [Lentisphaerae bacterium]|nr:1-acyl-sn-glycerol-3-phosphate acyltransferase [Lentisphaerota bacterium]